MTLNGAISELTILWNHSMMPEIFKGSIEKIIETVSECEEPRTGKWIRHNTYHGDNTSGYVDPDWRCSECGEQALVNEFCMYDLTDFCPNCGTDMREGDAK